MTNEYKAKLWNDCLSANIFIGCSESEVPKVQELFEKTIEENRDISTSDFISIMSVKIKQMTQMSYKDLIPTEKKPIIDFSDNIEEEPLTNIDKLIEQKQKERQNDTFVSQPSNPIVPTNKILGPSNIIMPTNPIASTNPILGPNTILTPPNKMIDIEKMIRQQNIILEQILESQIKILKHLQKK